MKRVVSLIICIVLTAGIIIPALNFFAYASSSTVTEDQETLNTLVNRLNSVKSEMDSVNSEAGELEEQREANYNLKIFYEKQTSLLAEEIELTNRLITLYGEKLEEMRLEKEEAEKQLNKQLDDYGLILRYYAEYGEVSSLELLFTSDGISDYLTRLDYISYIMDYNETAVADIECSRKRIDEAEENYMTSLSSLESYRLESEKTKEEYIESAKKLDELILELGDNLNLSAAEYEKLQKQEAELKKYIESVSSQIAEKLTYSETDYVWPILSASSVKYTYISDKFGYRNNPVTSVLELHNGLDIAVPAGTPILASKAGKVILAKFYGGYGNCVIVLHADGTKTLYGHCSKLLVSLGDTVQQSQVIARAGMTGTATGNHLHFTVYNKDGVAVNPATLLSKTILNKYDTVYHFGF